MTANTGSRREAPYTVARRTCAAFLSDHAHDTLPVSIDRSAVEAFRSEMDVEAIVAFGTSLATDSNFTGLNACDFGGSVDQEAAWIVLTHAVDFGSGWRKALHQHNHGKGAWLTIKAGVEALFQMARKDSATDLPATWLQSLARNKVATAFGIVDKSPELDRLVDYLWKVLLDLGAGIAPNYGSLQNLVAKALGNDAASTTPAGDFVWLLVDLFPTTFDDTYTVHNQRVCFYKKAQLVTGELYHRFRDQDARFRFADGQQMTAFLDNVIVAALRFKQIVVPNAPLTQAIEAGDDISMGSVEEVSLRAAALCAVDAIVQGTTLSSCELGNYLWGSLGKQKNVRQFARHSTKTLFY